MTVEQELREVAEANGWLGEAVAGDDAWRRFLSWLGGKFRSGEWRELDGAWSGYLGRFPLLPRVARIERAGVIAELEAAGMTQREIAATVGVDLATVSRSTSVANATLDEAKPKPDRSDRRHRTPLTEEQIAEIGRLYDAGRTQAQIAQAVGVGTSSVIRTLDRIRPNRKRRAELPAEEPRVETPMHRRDEFYLRSRFVHDLAMSRDWVQSFANRVPEAQAAGDTEWLDEIRVIVDDLALAYSRMRRTLLDPVYRGEVIREQRFRDSVTSTEERRRAAEVELFAGLRSVPAGKAANG